MITLRMLGIAVAILVGIPLAWGLADGPIVIPGGEIVDMSGEVVATVTNLSLVEPPQTYERRRVHDWPEQLVEGHTVFVQLLIPVYPIQENWTIDVVGNIECTHHVNASGPYFLGIPIPRDINEARVECRAGETVVATPDPFYDSNDTVSLPISYSSLSPTGNDIPFVAPNGVQGVAEEYEYWRITTHPDGSQSAQKRYAWATPVIAPWYDETGSLKTWYCPIPIDRIQEMGDITRFSAFVVDKPEDAVFQMNSR